MPWALQSSRTPARGLQRAAGRLPVDREREAAAGALYVHAKIGIVDDVWLTVGSANLNEHSFFTDTEMNVVTCDSRVARETRLRIWAEHLERSVEEVSGEPARLVDGMWRPIAGEQLERRRRGKPQTIGSWSSPASRAARWRSWDRSRIRLSTGDTG